MQNAKRPEENAYAAGSQRVRVLVIDDETSAAEGVQDILELEGHIVGVAGDQETALQAARMMAPDLALVDLRLKDQWGLDVIAALHKEFPSLLCIVQTGNSDSSAVISALRQGVYDYLVKPFQPDQLLKVTERAAEKITLEKERFAMLQELGQAKEQAELASQSKTEFLTRLGGELGSHFSTLVTLADSIAEEKLGAIGDQRYATCARGIASGCARMLENMRQIGQLGVLESGKMEIAASEFLISDALIDVVKTHQDDITRKQLALEFSVDEAIPPVQSDKTHFMEIIGHLISNAVKFSHPNGRLGVSASMDSKGDLWMQITDHGPGMREDQVGIAMAPFGQLENDQGGVDVDPFCAGLGLPLAKRLTQLLGGKIGLKSAVGAGTSARVFFPRDKVFEFAKVRNAVL